MAGAPEVETVADNAGAGVNAAGTTPEFKFGEYNTMREFTQAALRVYNQKDKVSLQNLINKDGSSKIGGLDLAVGDLTDAEKSKVGPGKSVTYKSGDVTVRFVVGKTGDIDFSLSTITEKGVTLKTDEIRSDTKYKHLAVLTQALRTEADTKQEAEASKAKQLPEMPVSGKSKEWLDIAKNASTMGDGLKVGDLTITSKVIKTSGQSGATPTEAGYDVTVKLKGNPNVATFQIGTDGKISEIKGSVEAVNNAIRTHNKAAEPKPAQPGTAQTPTVLDQNQFDNLMKGTVDWALGNLEKTWSSSTGSFASSRYSTVGNPPKAPMDPMTTGSCYLLITKGEEKMEITIRQGRVVGYSSTGQSYDDKLQREDFERIRRFLNEVNPTRK